MSNQNLLEKQTERGLVLQEAKDATNHNRDAVYGDPKINLACAGELKKLARKWAGIARGRAISDGEWEAIDLALTKVSRILTGTKAHRDNYVDGAAYFAIAYEIASSPKPMFVLPLDVMDNVEQEMQEPSEPSARVRESISAAEMAERLRPATAASPSQAPAAASHEPRRGTSS